MDRDCEDSGRDEFSSKKLLPLKLPLQVPPLVHPGLVLKIFPFIRQQNVNPPITPDTFRTQCNLENTQFILTSKLNSRITNLGPI